MEDLEPKDKPWEELCKMADDLVQKGAIIWGKFTCQSCGSRQTFETPNSIFAYGLCEECGDTTSLVKHGGGLLVLFKVGASGEKKA